jgi:glutamine---fructose-6-phosphate transaminase (isomerizing)
LSNAESTGRNGFVSGSSSGAYSLAEVISQPQCWADCLRGLETSKILPEIRNRFGERPEWLFIGCGSSYYIALAAAATWAAITGKRARAIPASELVLFPEIALADVRDFVPVFISRSGRTSEVLQAAELLQGRKLPGIAISCATGEKLEQLAASTIILPSADEQSTVMTRSFTSMLLSLQFLAGFVSGNKDFVQALQALPAAAERVMKRLPQQVRNFVNAKHFADYVCLGQGPYYGLACEGGLKLTEMSCSYAQVFHTLEFRHGPKSIVKPETLIMFLLSEQNYSVECDVLEEIKNLGGTTLLVTNRADRRARAAADFLVELGFDLPEYARLAPHVFAGQFMGLYTGLHKGLDPDRPRNLSRVVVLEGGNEKPQHAGF